MNAYRLRIELTLQTPVLSQAVGVQSFGVDAAARLEDGQVVLPGSLVRGNVRHSLELFRRLFPDDDQLPNGADIDCWLGRASDEADQKPHRGRLRFAHCWRCTTTAESETRNRIAINSATGTVGVGALQTIESPFATGQSVVFLGDIEFEAMPEEADRIRQCTLRALQFAVGIGAFKGVGFGKLLAVTGELSKRESRAFAVPKLGDDGFMGLRINPDRPLCFAKHHTGNNRFAAHLHIPGGALIGAIAEVLRTRPSAFSALEKHLDAIRILHAHPVLRGEPPSERPIPIPLSIVVVKDAEHVRHFRDVALMANAGLIRRHAPKFQVDWKEADRRAFRRAFHECSWNPLVDPPRRTLQVHAAISQATGVADTGGLFSMEQIRHEDHDWMAGISLAAIPQNEQQAVYRELCALFEHGVHGLGKTGASARVEPMVAVLPGELAPDIPDIMERPLVITLMSAARLLPDYHTLPACNGGEALRRAYATAWRDLSKDSLELRHFYATQELVGGNYMWRRFQSKQPYNPEALTTPGSVFVFRIREGREAQARRCLSTWLRLGLPSHPDCPGQDWRGTPYLPQNGYGEIQVNLPIHWSMRPGKKEWHELV